MKEPLDSIVPVHLEIDYLALESFNPLDFSLRLTIELFKSGVEISIVLMLDNKVSELALADLLVDQRVLLFDHVNDVIVDFFRESL